ncbi:hypothetical protein OPV22_006099 [Ensete ventricosum]|uniref:Uncharacterized protein n=1 Tax=Ensete ventricosum TaxID=4639 RepID=A0AAV8RSD0_ENSVE|nr:hypothetical protein OPV22_006099 [Ensete ventricosum]
MASESRPPSTNRWIGLRSCCPPAPSQPFFEEADDVWSHDVKPVKQRRLLQGIILVVTDRLKPQKEPEFWSIECWGHSRLAVWCDFNPSKGFLCAERGDEQGSVPRTLRFLRLDRRGISQKDWGADFRMMSAGAAHVGLTLWLDLMQCMQQNE